MTTMIRNYHVPFWRRVGVAIPRLSSTIWTITTYVKHWPQKVLDYPSPHEVFYSQHSGSGVQKTSCKNQKLLLGLGFGREIRLRRWDQPNRRTESV